MADTPGGMGRALTTGLLLLAALAILAGGLTVSWWSYEDRGQDGGPGMRMATGLRETRFCDPGRDRCVSAWLGEGADRERWVRAGMATYAAALVAAGLLFLGAVTVLLGRARELLIKTSLVAVLGAAASALVFVLLAPAQYREMDVGYSMVLLFAGALVGAGGALVALRGVSRPPGGAALASTRNNA